MIIKYIKYHWPLFIFVVIVSWLYGNQHLLHLQKFGAERYQPITLKSDFDMASTYFPRAKAVFEGQIRVGDINVTEYQHTPALLPMLNPIVMGFLGRLSGSMKTGVIVSDFLFPPIIFLLFYLFVFKLTQKRFLSLFVSSFFIFAIGLPFWELHHLAKPPLVSFPFSRFEFPKITYLFYLPAAYFTYTALIKRRTIFVILAGVFAGSLFYTDLYNWVSFFIGLGFLITFFLLQRNWRLVKVVGSIIAIGLVLSMFYWINFIALTHLPQYNDIAARVGVEFSHGIRFFTWRLYLRVALVIAALYFIVYKKDTLTTLYLTAFLLPLFVTLNLQVLTGMNPQPDHWGRPLIPFMYASLTMVGLFIYRQYLKRISPRFLMAATAVILFLLFSLETFYVFRLASLTAPQHVMPEKNAASYRWINDTLPKGAVIGSFAPTTNLDFQVHIQNKLFLPFGMGTISSNEEIWQRFFYLAKFYDISPDQIRDVFSAKVEVSDFPIPAYNREVMNLYLFMHAFHPNELNAFFKESKRGMPPEVLEEKIEKYSDIDLASPPFELDYIYFGPNERVWGATDPQEQKPDLDKVYEDDNVRVYKL